MSSSPFFFWAQGSVMHLVDITLADNTH